MLISDALISNIIFNFINKNKNIKYEKIVKNKKNKLINDLRKNLENKENY